MPLPSLTKTIQRITPWRVQRTCTKLWQRVRPFERNYRLEISQFGPFTVAYRGNTVDERVLAHSFDNDVFFAGVPEYQPASTDTIIDVGAHIGTFALLAASKVPQGKVFAVEACRESYNYLRVNSALNNLSNIDAAHVALCDKNGTATLFYDDATGNWGHSIMRSWSGRGETVTATTLADFMEEKSIAHSNFVKLNCEGAEFPILLGTSNEVLSRIDMILVLYHEDIASGYRHTQLVKKLKSCGFHSVIRQKGSYGRGWLVGSQKNHLAPAPIGAGRRHEIDED